MAKCTACGKFMSLADGIGCATCTEQYHRGCVGLPMNADISVEWKCPECKSKIPKTGNCSTPVRSITSDCTKRANDELLSDTARDTSVNLDLATELRMCREEMRGMRSEMLGFRTEMAKLYQTITDCNKKIDTLEARVLILEKQEGERMETDVSKLESELVELKAGINNRDQELLLNDVEISGIIETKGENPAHIVNLVATKLGVRLEERDIVWTSRVGTTKGEEDGKPGQPRIIVARFACRSIRDELLKAARDRRGATTADMNLTGPETKFFVNERLTKLNRQLFMKTRKCAFNLSEPKWKYVWTRDGRIFARRANGMKRHNIKNDTDFARVFQLADGCVVIP